MKTFVKTTGIVSLFALSGLAMASDPCPGYLNADEMYDCIVVEGAGGTYLKEKAQVRPQAKQAEATPAEKHPDLQARRKTQSSTF
ncbi:MAG: hypothetical protein PVG20_02730 [Thioalkalispiraceae bacterium]|jgi:hypothetical protein